MNESHNTPDEDIERRLDELDARLIEQEHRTVHVALNAYKYFGRDTPSEKRTAAMRALFWRVFAPYTVAAVLASGGTLVAGISAYFLYQQNQKLEAQTKLLERQTEIVAGEGQWELLWQAHYSPQPSAKLEAATKLANAGVQLSGLDLRGAQSPTENMLAYNESEQFFGAVRALSNIDELPLIVSKQTIQGAFSRFRVTLDGVTNRDVSGLNIVESEVVLGSAPFILDSRFDRVVLNPQGKGQTFRNCFFDKVLLERTPMGNGIQFRWSTIRSMAIDSQGSDRDGTTPVRNPGSAQSWQEYPIFIDESDVGLIYIRQTSMTGIRASRILKLVLEDTFSSPEELRRALTELLGTGNCVNEVEIRKMEQPGIDASLTAIADDWVKKQLPRCIP